MNSHLAEHLPLGKFPRISIAEGAELHHFGTLDASNHQLDRPIWVSDVFEGAHDYKNFGVPAPRYTKLITSISFEILDLNGVRLQPIAMQLKIYDHSEWNRCLAKYLSSSGVLGIVYAGREIFLPEPGKVIKNMSSQPC